jgi:enamine deaminase RidA (YjgF/YER057c/UK114 family)
MQTLFEQMVAAGLEIPKPLKPAGRYESFVWSGRQLWVAGQVPQLGKQLQYRGVVGQDVTVSDAQLAARLCALNILAVVGQCFLGDVEELCLININGFVRCTSDFAEHAKVMDGASELLLQVLGDRGKHARTSVGVAALPQRVPVEIASVWEVSSRGE